MNSSTWISISLALSFSIALNAQELPLRSPYTKPYPSMIKRIATPPPVKIGENRLGELYRLPQDNMIMLKPFVPGSNRMPGAGKYRSERLVPLYKPEMQLPIFPGKPNELPENDTPYPEKGGH